MMTTTIPAQRSHTWQKRPPRSLFLTAVLLLAFLAAGVSPVFAASTSINTFTNNTGAAVDDLHIDYNTAVTVTQNPIVFGATAGGGTSSIDLSSGTVLAGGTVQITATGDANKTKLKKWYWTLEGVQVGKTRNGCKAPDCTSP